MFLHRQPKARACIIPSSICTSVSTAVKGRCSSCSTLQRQQTRPASYISDADFAAMGESSSGILWSFEFYHACRTFVAPRVPVVKAAKAKLDLPGSVATCFRRPHLLQRRHSMPSRSLHQCQRPRQRRWQSKNLRSSQRFFLWPAQLRFRQGRSCAMIGSASSPTAT